MAKISINIATGSLQQNDIVVGIDLGTTNSLVAVIHPDTKHSGRPCEHGRQCRHKMPAGNKQCGKSIGDRTINSRTGIAFQEAVEEFGHN